jgi:hypothetical protein
MEHPYSINTNIGPPENQKQLITHLSG